MICLFTGPVTGALPNLYQSHGVSEEVHSQAEPFGVSRCLQGRRSVVRAEHPLSVTSLDIANARLAPSGTMVVPSTTGEVQFNVFDDKPETKRL